MKRLTIVAVALVVALQAVSAQNFTERDFKVVNRNAGITLGGTLTMPADGSPRAAVVLATGSGAQNRDEELLGFRPFKTLAEALSADGYAVLRLDDRGVGESQGDPLSSTLNDYVDDLTAAIAALDSCLTPDVPKGVVGHSEGGSAAIKIAASGNPSCRFIVTLAAPAWAGDSVIMSQARAMAVAMTGRWDGESRQRHILDMVKSPLPDQMLRSALLMELSEMAGDAVGLPQVQLQLRAQVDALCSPSYRALVRYNPADDIAAVAIPWLALNGDKDMQVLPANLSAIARLCPGATVCLLPDHNHLFQPDARQGHVAEYSTLSAPMSSATVGSILSHLPEMIRASAESRSHPAGVRISGQRP